MSITRSRCDSIVPEIARTFERNRRSWGATAGSFDGETPAVLCLDAHADFDTPEDNLSGFLDVMALSTFTGACWQALAATIPNFRPVPERDVLLVGVRDLDDYQREAVEAFEPVCAAAGRLSSPRPVRP